MSKVAKRRIGKPTANMTTQDIVAGLPLHVDTFTRIQCSREQATNRQRQIYGINKDNAAGRVYATRYDWKNTELLIWRMA